MRRTTVILLVGLAWARVASAQAIVQTDIQILSPSGRIWTNTVQLKDLQCNQPPPPVVPSPVANPLKFLYDDAANPGKVCIGEIGAPLLAALPSGTYTMTVTTTDDLGRTSEKSAPPVPFARAALLSVLTGVRLIR